MGARRDVVVRLDGDHEVSEISQRVGECRVDKVISHMTALGGGDDQATAAKAGQVVGHVGTGQAHGFSKLGRVDGSVEHRQQQLAAGRVGQRPTHSGQGLQPR